MPFPYELLRPPTAMLNVICKYSVNTEVQTVQMDLCPVVSKYSLATYSGPIFLHDEIELNWN